MDYEKKYNNALDRARLAIKDCGDNQGRKKMIYGIFPELAEIDDEKIRQEYIGQGQIMQNNMTQEKKKETKDAEGFIEIPLGAFDSETIGWTYTIPEGFTAKIEDGKIIVEKNESDDEKIRKEMIDYFSQFKEDGIRGVDITPWIIYLEKQKAVPENWNDVDRLMSHPLYLKGFDAGREVQKIMESDPDAIEKTPKQDYSGLNDFERAIHRGFLCAGVENVPVSIIKQTAEEALKRIPAEWSEDDKKMLDSIVNVLEVMPSANFIPIKRETMIPWLKSLPERFNFQPMQEWSEEEEKDIQEASDRLRDYANNYVQGGNSKLYLQSLADRIESLHPQPKAELDAVAEKEAYKDGFLTARYNSANAFMQYLDEHRPEGKMCLSNGECKDINKAFEVGDWAKIIRYINKYQPHWKPSEEQMKIFNEAVEHYSKHWDSEDIKILCSLYDDLKKL